jgi:hypothetical protein
MAPSPVAVTVASTSDRKHDSLWRSFSSAPPASQQCTTVGAQGDSGTARRQFRLLAGKREPVQAEFRCRGFIHDSVREPGSRAVYAGSNPAGDSRRHSWGRYSDHPAGAPVQLRRRRFRRGPHRVAAGGLALASLLAGPRDGADCIPGEGDLAGRHVRGVVVADLQPERLEQAAGDRVA